MSLCPFAVIAIVAIAIIAAAVIFVGNFIIATTTVIGIATVTAVSTSPPLLMPLFDLEPTKLAS